MNKVLLIGSVVFFALSLLCICSTTWRIVQGSVAMWSTYFWVAMVFHPTTGLIGLLLLDMAVPERLKRQEQEEETP